MIYEFQLAESIVLHSNGCLNSMGFFLYLSGIESAAMNNQNYVLTGQKQKPMLILGDGSIGGAGGAGHRPMVASVMGR